eukprot:2867784-Rhodomonas_salina.4
MLYAGGNPLAQGIPRVPWVPGIDHWQSLATSISAGYHACQCPSHAQTVRRLLVLLLGYEAAALAALIAHSRSG